jgi:hypothetical protein
VNEIDRPFALSRRIFRSPREDGNLSMEVFHLLSIDFFAFCGKINAVKESLKYSIGEYDVLDPKHLITMRLDPKHCTRQLHLSIDFFVNAVKNTD